MIKSLRGVRTTTIKQFLSWRSSGWLLYTGNLSRYRELNCDETSRNHERCCATQAWRYQTPNKAMPETLWLRYRVQKKRDEDPDDVFTYTGSWDKESYCDHAEGAISNVKQISKWIETPADIKVLQGQVISDNTFYKQTLHSTFWKTNELKSHINLLCCNPEKAGKYPRGGGTWTLTIMELEHC
jgi:hypothetical protein